MSFKQHLIGPKVATPRALMLTLVNVNTSPICLHQEDSAYPHILSDIYDRITCAYQDRGIG